MNHSISTYNSNTSSVSLTSAEILIRFLYAPRLCDFNAKEKDYESGFHYYGTRYYWSESLTGWLSVDPMMDKYPNISPYHYCSWNPINVVDPNGNDGVKIIDKQTHSVTVTATYYVTSQPIPWIPNTSYSPSEIESMQNDINNTLNS